SGLETSESERPVKDGGLPVPATSDDRVLPCYRRIQKAVNMSAAGSCGVESGGRGNTVMTLSRALPLALALAVMPLWPAAAQFGDMPGMPGSPGMSPATPGG